MSKSDHNIIETKINITWKASDAKVIKVFKYKDIEAQKRFKDETDVTTELSNIVKSNKPIKEITNTFVKRIKGFIHSNFKKVKIIDKPDKNLEHLYNKRRLLRNKTDEESVPRTQTS